MQSNQFAAAVTRRMLNEVSPEELKDKNLKFMPAAPCTAIDPDSIKSPYQLSKSLRVDDMQDLNSQCLI